MSDEFDYLTSETDKNVLKNLASMGEHLKKLKTKMLEAEAAYQQAKKEYEYYSSSVLPMEMFNAGVSSIALMSGGMMQYQRKFFCQPNKNAEDVKKMVEWLNAHGGGHLIEKMATVDGAAIDKLREADVPYIENCAINTNKLKAFLKDKIGANGGKAQIQIQDIPACMHFQEFGSVDIDV